MARPTKKSDEKLNRTLPPVRCTQNDYSIILDKAKACDQSITEYLRQMALDGKITVKKSSVNFELLQELKRSGNNLNQLSKRFHATGIEPHELRQTLNIHNQILRKVFERL